MRSEEEVREKLRRVRQGIWESFAVLPEHKLAEQQGWSRALRWVLGEELDSSLTFRKKRWDRGTHRVELVKIKCPLCRFVSEDLTARAAWNMLYHHIHDRHHKRAGEAVKKLEPQLELLGVKDW